MTLAGVVASLLGTFVALGIAIFTLKQNSKFHREQNRPYIVIYLDKFYIDEHYPYLVIKNIGKTNAIVKNFYTDCFNIRKLPRTREEIFDNNKILEIQKSDDYEDLSNLTPFEINKKQDWHSRKYYEDTGMTVEFAINIERNRHLSSLASLQQLCSFGHFNLVPEQSKKFYFDPKHVFENYIHFYIKYEDNYNNKYNDIFSLNMQNELPEFEIIKKTKDPDFQKQVNDCLQNL